jgi:hypothetical protein
MSMGDIRKKYLQMHDEVLEKIFVYVLLAIMAVFLLTYLFQFGGLA